MTFVLAGHPNNVWRDREEDHAEYNVSGSNDKNDTAKDPREVMNLGAHEHVFYSALQLPPSYNAFLSDKEEWASIREDSGKSGSKSHEIESAELRQTFEIANLVLIYIRAVPSYQQTTAVKRAAYKICGSDGPSLFAVESVISGAS